MQSLKKTLLPHMRDQDDRLGEDQSFGIAIVDYALSPVILAKEGLLMKILKCYMILFNSTTPYSIL